MQYSHENTHLQSRLTGSWHTLILYSFMYHLLRVWYEGLSADRRFVHMECSISMHPTFLICHWYLSNWYDGKLIL